MYICIYTKRIYLFSTPTVSPSSAAASLQQTAVINRQNNDILSKTTDKSLFDNYTANKIKMNENQTDGTT